MSAGVTPTSDELGPRRMRAAAVAAALAAAVALAVAPSGRTGAPGPLSGSHERAGLTCPSCHHDGPRESACVGCHGPHPSTRPAHASLAEQGALGCPRCHSAHSGPEAFHATGTAVARVPLTPCASCHALDRPADPARACVAGGTWTGLSACLDEHQTPSSPLPPRGRCAAQHGPSRYVAWEQARAAPPDPPASSPGRGAVAAPWGWVGSGMLAGALALVVAGRKRRAGTMAASLPGLPPPRALHRLPRIEASRCLGCQACVDACPFGVLAVERHLAVVARPDACCGVGACEPACPNGSLRLVARDEPVAGLPRVDGHLESLDRPGVFVAGDLTGVPLIRNAIAQGARVAERVHATRGRAGRPVADPEALELLVIGAGPAGLSAALRARQLGLTCRVLEQSALAASIRAFPRGKIVHDAPLDLPLEGALWMREATREELVGHWTRIVRTHRLEVLEGHKVTSVAREGPWLVARSEASGRPMTHRASHVLLATGTRGTPRALGAQVTPAAAGMIAHSLSDARALGGQRVLVVGLGDAAMEAIVALARQPGTRLTVSYRGADFARGSPRNIEAVRRLVAAGRVRLMLSSTVVAVGEGLATLRTGGALERVEVDRVLALLGGEPSRALLDACGIAVESPPASPERG